MLKIKEIKKLIKDIKKEKIFLKKNLSKYPKYEYLSVYLSMKEFNFILYCLKKELKNRQFENYEQYFKKYYEHWLEKLWNEKD